jgi:gliding motility-associated-like protein
MTPAADSIQDNPVPTATVLINGSTYYKYEVKNDFVFSVPGNYAIPVEYTDAAIENCTNTMQKLMLVKVVASPVANFNISYSGCLNDAAQLIATVTAENGDAVDKYKWNFGDATTSREPAPSKQYAAAGIYTITLDALTKAGCIVTVTKPVTVKNVAVVTFVNNVVSGCPDSDVTLAIKDPQTGVAYNWYEALTGGTAVHTGTSLVVSKINATKKYYVDAVLNGCGSRPRQEITAALYPVTATPVVSVDSIAIDLVRFKWNAVPGVIAYQVSVDGGNTWITPSSGTAGLTHTVTGLQGGKEVKLRVKAVDPNGCVDGISADVITHTLPAEVFIPNAFTPNGDSKNDVFKVEGYVIRSMQLMIFNQWGTKVFETADQAEGWDGRYKGQSQPSGVYIYVCNMILQDGSRLVKKGAVNLVR